MPRIAAAVLAAALVPHGVAAAMQCPEVDMDTLTIDGVQQLLAQWNVEQAFGEEFLAQQVDGVKLSLLSAVEAVNPAAYPRAQPFDWLALRKHLDTCAADARRQATAAKHATETDGTPQHRRRMQTSEASGVHIKRDNACLVFGSDSDVSTCRTDAGEVTVDADDFIVSGDLTVNGHVYLTDGDVNADNLDELALEVASLIDTVEYLQTQITWNGGNITHQEDWLTNMTDVVEQNVEDIDRLFDRVAILDYSANPYDDRVVYVSNFEDSFDEWTFHGKDLQTFECGDYLGIGGNLEEGDSVSLYLDSLPGHNKMTVSFTFIAIDTWDGERAAASVDGSEIWYDEFDMDDAGAAQVCAGTGKENVVTVSKTFQHFTHGAALEFTTTVDQGYEDETWSVADISVETTLNTDYQLEYISDFEGDAAAGWTFLGGDDAQVTECGPHSVLGGANVTATGDSLVKTLEDMDDHTELIIAFEFVKIDAWDGESAKLFVDNSLVWSQPFDDMVGTSSICGNAANDSVVPVTLRVPHHEAQAMLRFASTIDDDTFAMSWGIRSLAVYATTPEVSIAYQTNFAEVGDWFFSSSVPVANQKITTCGTYSVLGGYPNLDNTDSVDLYLDDLIPHSTMTITFDFVRIDSWDNEYAYVYVDDELLWKQQLSGLNGANICGGGGKDQIIPIELTFPHYAQGVHVRVQGGLSSAGTDESWGISNFKMTTELDDCTEIAYQSDFTSDGSEGWTIVGAQTDNTTLCGNDAVIGGYNNFGVGAEAHLDVKLDSPGHGVIIAFTFLKIDSWDTEAAQLYVDGLLVWSEVMSANAGAPLCGASSSGWHEDKVSRTVDLGWIAGDEFTLKFTSTLDSAATDESWGLTDVDVYQYEACDAVAFTSDFALQGASDWVFTGATATTTTCGAYTLLGGYNTLDYTDEVSRLFDLPMHTSMKVEFTFVKLDTWDSGEKAVFRIDHSDKWSEALSGGSQVCGNGAADRFYEKSFTTAHFAPNTWLQWQGYLSSAGNDESWGLAGTKITTYMDPNYIPVYESRFQFKQMDGWVTTGTSASNMFSTCGKYSILGGYGVFGSGATVSKTITDLPTHTKLVVGITWLRVDSWDSERFYVYVDGALAYTSPAYGAAGQTMCGGGWAEEVYSFSITVTHASSEAVIKFTSNINSGATDESFGLQAVSAYVTS